MRPLLRSWRHKISQIRREHIIRGSQPFTPIETLAKSSEAGIQEGGLIFEGERAFALLEKQCAFGPRIPGTPEHRATREFLLRELGLWTDEVAVQHWNQSIASGAGKGSTVPLTNIFARLYGTSEPAEVRPRLMLCAHWDTRPVADQDPDAGRRSLPVPGANDGASGVAVLLELARVLRGRKPDFEVLFGLFDGEDLGAYYYGSRMYARYCNHPSFARWRSRQAILLDMVGKRDLCCTTELHSRERAPQLWREIHNAAARLGLQRHFEGPERRINDDHVFLNAAGIPSIVLIDYTYPFWHTTADTVDKCSPESLQIIGDVLLEYLFDGS